MRWYAYPIALVAGIGLALAMGASAQSACPSGYHQTTRHRIVLCLRTFTRTITVTHLADPPARTVTVVGAATTLPATTTTVPTTLTVTAPIKTDTVTQAYTQTQTVVSTETTTAQAPPITTTVTVTLPAATTAAPSTVSLAWCGGYGGNWSSGNCDAPPSPLSVPSGSRVELAAVAQGGSATDPAPAGCLDFTVPKHPVAAVWSEYDQEYGLNPAASRDCSCVENFSGQASGACLYTFGAAGVYEVSVASGLAPPIATDVQVG